MVTHSFGLWETIKGELCQSSNTASSSQEQEGGGMRRENCVNKTQTTGNGL